MSVSGAGTRKRCKWVSLGIWK